MTRRERLALRRRHCGFTQESLAARLGVERSTVARWETGLSRPRGWARNGLAELLGVSLDELDGLFEQDTPVVPDVTG